MFMFISTSMFFQIFFIIFLYAAYLHASQNNNHLVDKKLSPSFIPRSVASTEMLVDEDEPTIPNINLFETSSSENILKDEDDKNEVLLSIIYLKLHL